MIFLQAGMGLFLLELFTFFFTVGKIGFFKTFALWLFSAVLGIWLVQTQGLATAARMQDVFNRGEKPGAALFESLCLFAAGALFIFPGFISDVLAFCLLIPFIRDLFKRPLAAKFKWSEQAQAGPAQEGVIEGDYVRVEEECPRLPPDQTGTN